MTVSPRTRVLVTGAAGQIGREVVDACAGDEVIAADHATLDVGDRDAVLQTITSAAPDVVVHAGAWTAVDACEGDPDRAFQVNALGTRYVAEGARRVGAWVCYLSTDYVFDGTKPEPYVEWDAPSPVSVYGRSKLGGEWEVDGGSATIVRTSWVCGLHGSNMVKTILRLAGEHEKLAFVDDQRGQPSFADDLAPMIRRLAVDRRPGVFHVTNQGAVSWFEFAARRAGGRRPRSRAGAADRDRRPRPAPTRAAPGQLGARQRRPAPRGAAPPPPLPGAVGAPRAAPAVVTGPDAASAPSSSTTTAATSPWSACGGCGRPNGRPIASRSCSSTTRRPTVSSTECRAEWPDVGIIASDRNLGFAGGCNLALRDLDDFDDGRAR